MCVSILKIKAFSAPYIAMVFAQLVLYAFQSFVLKPSERIITFTFLSCTKHNEYLTVMYKLMGYLTDYT